MVYYTSNNTPMANLVEPLRLLQVDVWGIHGPNFNTGYPHIKHNNIKLFENNDQREIQHSTWNKIFPTKHKPDGTIT